MSPRTKPVPEPEAVAPVYGGKIANAPTTPNNGGFENRAATNARVSDPTSGANAVVKGAQAFEQRATQESGTH